MTITTDLVLDALTQIGSVRGSKDKARLLKEALEHPLFLRCVSAAVNPFITYGLQDMPPVPDAAGTEVFDDRTWNLLDALAERKLTGHAAMNGVAAHLTSLTLKSRELLKRVIRKDLRAGFSDTLVNQVRPGTVPVFACMRGETFDLKKLQRMAKKHGKPAFPLDADIKYDGIRTLFVVDVGASVEQSTALAVSRNGLPLPAMQWMSEKVIQVAMRARLHLFPEHTKFVGDFEGVGGDMQAFEDTASALKKQSVEARGAILRAIDILPWVQFTGKEQSETQEWRRAAVQSLLTGVHAIDQVLPAESYTVHSYEELLELYGEVLDKGHEGLIAKPHFGRYEPKKSPYWMKLKLEETYDVQVTGAYEGKGQFEGSLGGLTVDFKGVEVNIGGGFSPEQRAQWWADHVGREVSYQLVDPDSEEVVTHVVQPTGRPVVDRVIEVLSNGVTKAGSLRHPRFIKERTDLRPEEVEGNK